MSVKVTYKELWPDHWYISDGENIHGPLTAIETFSTFETISQVVSKKINPSKDNLLVSRKGFSTWYQYNDLQLLYVKGSIGKDTVVANLKKDLLSEIDRLKTLLPQKNEFQAPDGPFEDNHSFSFNVNENSHAMEQKAMNSLTARELGSSAPALENSSDDSDHDGQENLNFMMSHRNENALKEVDQRKSSASMNRDKKNQVESFYLEKYGDKPPKGLSVDKQVIQPIGSALPHFSQSQSQYQSDAIVANEESAHSSGRLDSLNSIHSSFQGSGQFSDENQPTDTFFSESIKSRHAESEPRSFEIGSFENSSFENSSFENSSFENSKFESAVSEDEISEKIAFKTSILEVEKSDLENAKETPRQRGGSSLENPLPTGVNLEPTEFLLKKSEVDSSHRLEKEMGDNGQGQKVFSKSVNSADPTAEFLIKKDIYRHQSTSSDKVGNNSQTIESFQTLSKSFTENLPENLSETNFKMQLTEVLGEQANSLISSLSVLAYAHMMTKGRLRLGEIHNPLLVALKSCLWFTIPGLCARLYEDLIWHLNEPGLKKESDSFWISMFPLLNLFAFFRIIKALMRAESQNQYRSVSFILGFLLSFFPPAVLYYLQLKTNKHWKLHVHDHLKRHQTEIS